MVHARQRVDLNQNMLNYTRTVQFKNIRNLKVKSVKIANYQLKSKHMRADSRELTFLDWLLHVQKQNSSNTIIYPIKSSLSKGDLLGSGPGSIYLKHYSTT